MNNFFGKAFEVYMVLVEDADNNLRVDASIIMDDEVAKIRHLGHGFAHWSCDVAVFGAAPKYDLNSLRLFSR